MKVLSIPSGDTGNLIHRYKLYICPHTDTYESKLGDYHHLSFRHLIGKIKGATDRIYERVKIVDLDFTNGSFYDAIRSHPDLTDTEKKIVKDYYVSDHAITKKWMPPGRYLLVFVREEQLLPNKPHPPVNNTFWAIYDSDDLLNKTVLEK